MNLKSGIVIKSDLPNYINQLSINSGCTHSNDEPNIFYTPDSFIPKKNWRPISENHKNKLLHRGNSLKSNSIIRIGKVTDKLEAIFQKIKLRDCINLDDVYPTIRKNEETVKNLTKELDLFFEQFSTKKKYKFHRITRAMPNRDTITCHYINDKFIYIGLHVDRSRLYTLHTAHKSGNRISINLGKESRYLAIVNLTLIQAYNMIRIKIGSEKSITPNNIASLFFSLYPEYPIVKIEIKPYQFYIAPTDNFFHDATTIGMKSLDITLVYTGNFDII